jgi:diguanylate cyclase
VPPNTPVLLLGIGLGTSLLLVGLLLGFFLGRRGGGSQSVVDRAQFLSFLQNLSAWTSEFAGDVSNYQSQLTQLSQRVGKDSSAPQAEIASLLSQIMRANQQLQQRLDSAEARLESQTHQIADYLTEARTDGLTGLTNRRAFDQTLDELFIAWQSRRQAFTVALVDIDHFKQINDTHGHPAGDTVLQKVSEVLRSEFREAVCVARYGGEEFAILTTVPAEEASQWLDHVRDEISRREFDHEGTRIPVTLSGGVAMINDDCERIGKLVRRSDEALYASKLGGRNRIHWHDGVVCHLVTRRSPGGAPQVHSAPRAQAAAGAASVATTPAEADAESRVQQRLEKIVQEETRRPAGADRQP